MAYDSEGSDERQRGEQGEQYRFTAPAPLYPSAPNGQGGRMPQPGAYPQPPYPRAQQPANQPPGYQQAQLGYSQPMQPPGYQPPVQHPPLPGYPQPAHQQFQPGYPQPQPGYPRHPLPQPGPYPQRAFAPLPFQLGYQQAVVKRSTASVLGIIGVCLLAPVLIGVLIYLVWFLGLPTVALALLVALVPLTVVLAVVAWIDRWEPEPKLALAFAFLWGAAASVAIALIVDLGVQVANMLTGLSGGSFAQAVIQAPIVEETAKGIGVLILFYAARKHFDGPLDGLVYGAVVAAGFAFTENIQYFGIAVADGGLESLSLTFFMRAILSPFAHVMFTALTGLALGIAARRTGGAGALGYFVVGLLGAMLLHALWNGAASLVESLESFIVYYVVVQVPLFIGAVVMTVLVRRHEITLTAARLTEYAMSGWLTPAEVRMLSTWAGRRQARAWAATLPGRKSAVMKQFTRDATRLAMTRQRIISGRLISAHQKTEEELLQAVWTDRQLLLGP